MLPMGFVVGLLFPSHFDFGKSKKKKINKNNNNNN